MKKLFRRLKIGYFPIGDIALVSLLIVGLLIQFSLVYAGTFADLHDKMNRMKQSLASGVSHTVVFTTAGAVAGGPGNNVVKIDFPGADDTLWCRTAGALTAAACTEDSATELPGTLAATCSQTNDQIEITGVNNLAATTKYCVTITDTGTGDLGTPTTATTGLIIVTTNNTTTDVDSGTLAVDIVTNEQVVVSATVEPSITFTLGANTANLGTLSTGAINTASSSIQTGTNASSGFSTTVYEDNNLRIDASHDIDDVTGDVDLGSEEYGMSTTDSGQTIETDTEGNCNTSPNPKVATAITATAQTVAGATGPVDETNSFCLAASISSTTTAGAYSHTLTFVTTGLF